MADRNCIMQPTISILQTSMTTECNTSVRRGKPIVAFLLVLLLCHHTNIYHSNEMERKKRKNTIYSGFLNSRYVCRKLLTS